MAFAKSPKINRKLMPQPAANRTVRYRYDWADLEIGEGFAFGPTVKIMSARVMCANNGTNLDRVFRCYRGIDDKLYAIRMASLFDELPNAAEEPEAPRITAATAPEAKEMLGDFGSMQGRMMRDNALAVTSEEVSTLNDTPPQGPSPSQLRAAAINAERETNIARRKAEGREDDVDVI